MPYTQSDRLSRAAHLLSRTIKQAVPYLTTPCMVWQGATDRAGQPKATVRQQRLLVRRYVYETLHGQAFGYLKAKCGNLLCINPDHQREA